MKLTGLLISCLFLLNGCDPFQLVYIKNYSNDSIIVNVHLSNKYPHPKPFEIRSKDSLIEDKNALFDIKFNNRLSVNNLNDSLYQAILPKGSTTLLEPVCMGFPIMKVYVNSRNIKDSVIFYGPHHNLRQLKQKKLLKKAGVSDFIIDFGK